MKQYPVKPCSGKQCPVTPATHACENGVLYQGDCLEIMAGLPDRSVPLILCDLPYGVTNNAWDHVLPLGDLWTHYKRLLKPKGVIALTSQGLFTARLIMSNRRWFRYKLVWVKDIATNFLNARRQPLRKYEDICVFYERQPAYYPVMSSGKPYESRAKDRTSANYGTIRPHATKNTGERFPADVFYCRTSRSEARGKTFHPTQKPVALGRYLIRTFTRPGDTILDNTCGSGSFLVAAVLEGRRYIGIEKDSTYCKAARERLLSLKKGEQRPPDRSVTPIGRQHLSDLEAVLATSPQAPENPTPPQ